MTSVERRWGETVRDSAAGRMSVEPAAGRMSVEPAAGQLSVDSAEGQLSVDDPVVEAVLTASRALVAVAARSIAAAGGEVTLPQYRTLVLIAARGPQRLATLAEALDVNQSTASRMCDRLVAKRLVRRSRSATDRRTVRIALTPEGRALVDGVTRHRRGDLARILAQLTQEQRDAMVAALNTFSLAADEQPIAEGQFLEEL